MVPLCRAFNENYNYTYDDSNSDQWWWWWSMVMGSIMARHNGY